MTRHIPITIRHEVVRNDDESVWLLVSADVYPSTDFREPTHPSYPDGALQMLDDDGAVVGPWQGRLTEAEEAEMDRAVLAAFDAWEREQAEMAGEVA